MFIHAQTLHGRSLSAIDGEIGKISDLYFDDLSWNIRYLVVNCGGWILNRLVLIGPESISTTEPLGQRINVNLQKEQIRTSPSWDTQQPVSRRMEYAYRTHFGWTWYWDAITVTAGALPEPIIDPALSEDVIMAHLRSINGIQKYQIISNDGLNVPIVDFVIDDQHWHIASLIFCHAGKFGVLPITSIAEIDWNTQTVQTRLNRAELEVLVSHSSLPSMADELTG